MPNSTELADMNRAADEQEKCVQELEDRLFLEQLRLAALKSARQRMLRRIISDEPT